MDNLKGSVPDIEQQAFIIAPYLTAYFERQDRARRFTQPGFMTRELTSYYHAKQRQDLETVSVKSFYLGVIRGARKRMREIKKLVTVDTPLDEAHKLYAEMLLLQDEMSKAYEVLNG